MDSNAATLNIEIKLKNGKTIKGTLNDGDSYETSFLLYMTADGENNDDIQEVGNGLLKKYAQTLDVIAYAQSRIKNCIDVASQAPKATSMGPR